MHPWFDLFRDRSPLACCCRELGIPAEELRVDPRPVTPQLLQHSQQIDARLAVDIVAALRAEGLIDEVRRRRGHDGAFVCFCQLAGCDWMDAIWLDEWLDGWP